MTGVGDVRLVSFLQATLVVAVLLTACGGEATQPLTDVDEVPAAVSALQDDSVAWEMSLDVDFDLDEVVAVADTLSSLGRSEDGPDDDLLGDVAEAREVVDLIARLTLSGATDDDGNASMAFNVDGEPAVELAAGGQFTQSYMALGADPMAMLDTEPLPIQFYLRVDGDRLGGFVAEVSDSTSQADVDEFLAELRDDPAATLSGDADGTFDDLVVQLESIPAEVREDAGIPEPSALVADIEALVQAAVSGEWFGLDGELDYAAMLDSMGMTREQLEAELEAMGRHEDAQTFDPEDFQRVFEDAVTYRDLAPGEGGAATVTMDVDVEALALGYFEAMEAYDTLGVFADAAAEVEAQQLPVLEGVGTVTLAGQDVTEMRIDLLRIALAFAELDESISPQEVTELREALDSFETTRAQLVIRYLDHGQVTDILAGIDAATLDASLLGAMAAMSMVAGPGPGTMSGLDTELDSSEVQLDTGLEPAEPEADTTVE